MDSRKYHSAVVTQDDKIVFFGGIDSQGIANSDIRIYNLQTSKWQLHSNEPAHPESPGCLYGHASIYYGNFVFLFGGATNTGFSKQTYFYYVPTDEWSSNTQPVISRKFLTAVIFAINSSNAVLDCSS